MTTELNKPPEVSRGERLKFDAAERRGNMIAHASAVTFVSWGRTSSRTESANQSLR